MREEMEDTLPAAVTIPDRTFSSTLHRFFDTSDQDHVYSKNHVAAGSRNASASRSTIWATSTSTSNPDYEGREKENGSIATRRARENRKAKSALNLYTSSKRPNANANVNANTLSSTNTSANVSTTTLPTSPPSAVSPSSPRFITHRRSESSFQTPASLTSDPATPRSSSPSANSKISESASPSATLSSTPKSEEMTSETKRLAGENTCISISRGKKVNTIARTPTFELTPLSTLIVQSLKDIEMLKRVQGHRRGIGIGDGIAIDFDSLFQNLKNFEAVYKAYLQTSTSTNINETEEPCDEVHLLAMVCKRREVVRGGLSISGSSGSAGTLPRVKVADCCL
ncbi:hypothetical protein IFR04_006539 [Cadophora malorum]|uniref:Uncharacterized protein n=1 Tax=Cadophora malorum TaxID=108018 RepID=A0A8H7TK05_9HELO|nr:hypothetical protein IFR04_006539 [Cadophora malorum]